MVTNMPFYRQLNGPVAAAICPFGLGLMDFNRPQVSEQDRFRPEKRRCAEGQCVGQLLAFIKSICWRARKTILSPALVSPDTVHKRPDTLSGSIRSTLQNVSSPNRCCSS
jgi:hypothetical protein